MGYVSFREGNFQGFARKNKGHCWGFGHLRRIGIVGSPFHFAKPYNEPVVDDRFFWFY